MLQCLALIINTSDLIKRRTFIYTKQISDDFLYCFSFFNLEALDFKTFSYVHT
jgi:hypothetical protein